MLGSTKPRNVRRVLAKLGTDKAAILAHIDGGDLDSAMRVVRRHSSRLWKASQEEGGGPSTLRQEGQPGAGPPAVADMTLPLFPPVRGDVLSASELARQTQARKRPLHLSGDTRVLRGSLRAARVRRAAMKREECLAHMSLCLQPSTQLRLGREQPATVDANVQAAVQRMTKTKSNTRRNRAITSKLSREQKAAVSAAGDMGDWDAAVELLAAFNEGNIERGDPTAGSSQAHDRGRVSDQA